jgi:acetyl esterase/lipase
MKPAILAFSLGIVFGGQAIVLAQSAEFARTAAERFIRANDKDGDGKLSADEFPQGQARLFSLIDKDKNGQITQDEDAAFRLARNRQRGNQNADQNLPEGATVLRDVVYAQVGERKLPLDLYLPPKQTEPVPVVVWIHGGSWKSGQKGNAGPARPLVSRGYAVVDVEYRLSGEAIFPAQVEDCKAAIRWIRANAKEHNLDADHIGVWGSSAGGHLAAFLGTSGDVKEFETETNGKFSSRVQAVCDWFGPTDLLKMNAQAVPGAKMDHDAPGSPESQLLGGPIQKEPFRTRAGKANPMTYVTKDDPPLLIVHGDNDLLVSHRQSEMLQDSLAKAGVVSELKIVKNGGHGFGGGDVSREDLFEQAARFFDKHLKPKK